MDGEAKTTSAAFISPNDFPVPIVGCIDLRVLFSGENKHGSMGNFNTWLSIDRQACQALF